jgi:Outer membrane protein beta-barrel domain
VTAPHTSASLFEAGLVVITLTAVPTMASADWLIAGYIGASHTASSTLRVRPDASAPFDLSGIEFRSESWQSPIYYGYRIGWRREQSALGIEAEFTHAKTIAVETRSATLTQFAQSHGLNFVLGNVTYQSRARCGGRCVLVGRAGGGITIPHVEATYVGTSVSSYQFGGPAFQGGVGLEVVAHSGLLAILDGRVTYAKVTDDLPGATLSSSFTTWHFTFGAGWRFEL